MAVAKKTTTTKVSMAKEAVVEPIVETKAPEVKGPKKFEKDELIPCRSVTPGMLLYNGISTIFSTSKLFNSWFIWFRQLHPRLYAICNLRI